MKRAHAVRPATIGDLAGLLALEDASFETHQLSRRSFHHMLTRANADLLVARGPAGSGLLGYALVLYRRGTGVARLYSLAVAPQARRKGLALQLLRSAERHAAAQGARVLSLEVHPENPAARGLYRQAGYSLQRVVEDYYEDGADALRLQRRLTTRPA